MSQPSDEVLNLAVVAGEASGDLVGAGLIREVRRHYPDARCYGIGGPLMRAEGFDSLYPMERLSVMGLIEVLSRLRELLGIRRQLGRELLARSPDVFVGIDAPDFNLSIEKKLKLAGIPTVHYVSPQVWAWRGWRIKKISQSVDHMLVLLPFEVDYYRTHSIPVTYVGHPLADQIPMQPDSNAARKLLGISGEGTIVGLLPGSRKLEVGRLASVFFETARLLKNDFPDIRFLVPCVNEKRKKQVLGILESYSDLDVTIINGQAQSVMAVADALLVASGTAALEVALHKKPMVISYKAAPLTFAIVSRLVKVKYVALPNLLAGRELVPEILQDEATPDRLAIAMKRALQDQSYRQELHDEFVKIHKMLRHEASIMAVRTIESLIKKTGEHATD